MSPTLATLLPAETSSAADTVALGAALAAELRAGDVVALYGDLGAGKTHLAKGICAGLGVPPDEVTSPTFTIVQEYAGELPVYHVDAYRVERIEELFELGYEDFFYGEGVTVIEWADRIEALVPEHALRLRLSHVDEDRRRIEAGGGMVDSG